MSSNDTSSNDRANDLSFCFDMLERLWEESFNEETNRKLDFHPYLVAAKEGRLTLPQRRAFAGEQYAIQHSDACSFASLAGHDGFFPSTLSEAEVPSPTKVKPDDLFQFLLSGEVYASNLLLEHAKSVGLDTEDALRRYPVSARAQAYPSYWARLALSKRRGAGAAACAVNFPAWGNMCAELSKALKTRPEYGYKDGGDDGTNGNASSPLAFIDFFATPIDNLDTMATKIMKEEDTSYDEIVTVVRLLQGYEVMFWDAIYEAR